MFGRHNLLRCLGTMALATLTHAAESKSTPAASRPNFIFILTDDIGRHS